MPSELDSGRMVSAVSYISHTFVSDVIGSEVTIFAIQTENTPAHDDIVWHLSYEFFCGFTVTYFLMLESVLLKADSPDDIWHFHATDKAI